MKSIRVGVKLVCAGSCIASYLAHCACAELWWNSLWRQPERSRQAQVRAISFWSKVTLFFLGVRVRVKGLESPEKLDSNQSVFLVSNHQSYLDVLALSSVWVSAFVTSIEVRMSGLLGMITRLGGCLFVERRSRENLPREKAQIAEVIRQGTSVFVFPEGTSSNGVGVLPFKAALFDCAILAGVPVQPVVLKYSKINGKPPSQELLDCALYYGDHEFLTQFLKLLSLKSIEVELRFLPRHSTEGLLTDGTGRKLLASKTHSLISTSYGSLSRE